MMTRVTWIAILFVGCTMFGGCSDSTAEGERSPGGEAARPPGQAEEIMRADILMTNPYGKDVVGEQGTVHGTLETSDSGCVAVRTSDGQFPLWAFKGSLLSADGEGVTFPGIGEFSLGDNVTLPGGIRTFNAPSRELLPSGYDICFSQSERKSKRVTAAVVETPVAESGS